ncbi:MAG: hypothetical protein WBM50_18195 [Acidimicrobiales bacterium]
MHRHGWLTAVVVTGCGGDDTGAGDATPTTVATTTSVPTSTPGEEPTPTSAVVGLEQPAIWPAADIVFSTPVEAAEDFVTEVLGVPAGPVTVEGVGRGFEALVVVEAFKTDDPVALDQVITPGGSMETAEPFSVPGPGPP